MAYYYSKHQRWTTTGDWIPGKCKIVANSSLRKLMRAARQGKVPDDRMFIIGTAMLKAQERRNAKTNTH